MDHCAQWPLHIIVTFQDGADKTDAKALCLENLESNVLKRVADQQLKRWFAAGAHSCTFRKTGSAYCYLRTSFLISPA